MSDTAAALRTRARECEHKANLVKDEESRTRFLDLARVWREMAADYEDLCKKGTENNPPSAHTGDEATRWFADDTLPEWREP